MALVGPATQSTQTLNANPQRRTPNVERSTINANKNVRPKRPPARCSRGKKVLPWVVIINQANINRSAKDSLVLTSNQGLGQHQAFMFGLNVERSAFDVRRWGLASGSEVVVWGLGNRRGRRGK
jgi:hypothetical protein